MSKIDLKNCENIVRKWLKNEQIIDQKFSKICQNIVKKWLKNDQIIDQKFPKISKKLTWKIALSMNSQFISAGRVQ